MCLLRLCGHRICWHKPIKLYNLVRHTMGGAVFVIAFAGFAAMALAGEAVPAHPVAKTSTADAVRLSALSPESGEATVGIVPTASSRIQRTAGEIPVPAMALAVALGLRNVPGPMERTVKGP